MLSEEWDVGLVTFTSNESVKALESALTKEFRVTSLEQLSLAECSGE